MPLLASRSDATTSLAFTPMEETMPKPVTATRRMFRFPISAWLGNALEADAQVFGVIDRLAVGLHHPVADAHHQAPVVDHPFHVDLVGDQLDVVGHLAAELHHAAANRPAAALAADPAEVEADQLPQRIQAQAAGHHRIAEEMAVEEPEAGIDVEFGLDVAQPVLAAVGVD